MKKILKLSLIILLVVLLAFAITGCGEKEENNVAVEQDNGKSKTYNLFSQVFSGNSYIMSFEGEMDLGEGTESAVLTVAVKENNVYTDVDATSQHLSVIVKDNTTYIISHDEKICMTTQGEDESILGDDMLLISEDQLKEMENQEYTTGKETIDGTEYEYEEYKDQEIGISERYYFSGSDLKYVKSIDEDGEEEIMKIIKLSSDVDSAIFNVPEGYQVIDASSLEQ